MSHLVNYQSCRQIVVCLISDLDYVVLDKLHISFASHVEVTIYLPEAR